MRYSKTIIITLLIAITACSEVWSQQRKVTFNGNGRSIMTNDVLGGEVKDTDTTSLDRSFSGYAFFDLAMTARPNKSTQLEAEIRLRNEFSGFWGAGTTVELRKIYLQGMIRDRVRYHVGDFNFHLSPYTFYNHEDELARYEPGIFSDFRSFNYTDNLYGENSWRQQGIKFDVGLGATKGIKQVDFTGFITRTRGANFFANPDRFFSGFELSLKQSDLLTLGGRYVNLFDIPSTSATDQDFSNSVGSVNAELKKDIDKGYVAAKVEVGGSNLRFPGDTLAPDQLTDFFVDASLSAKLNNMWSVTLNYRDVGSQFYSAGAQTKQIDYNLTPTFFGKIGNIPQRRSITLFDAVYEETVYNEQIHYALGAYPIKYGNVQPYGLATPNRRGLSLNISYSNPNWQALEWHVEPGFFTEVVGEGTAEKRNFLRLRGGAEFHFNELYDSEKKLDLSLGWQYESASRDGSEVEQVDFESSVLGVGLEWEFVENLELLGGARIFSAKGNEYIGVRNEYNEIYRYFQYDVEESQNLFGIGLKYGFGENVYVSAQYVKTDIKDHLTADFDYSISRMLFVYHMKF